MDEATSDASITAKSGAKNEGRVPQPPPALERTGLYFPAYWLKKQRILMEHERPEAVPYELEQTILSRIASFFASLVGMGGSDSALFQQTMIEAWGWGDTEADANEVADYRLSRAIERIKAGETDWDQYGYGLGGMPLREPLLETVSVDQDGQITAAITRNRYSCLILSTRDLMMIDIDLVTDPSDSEWATHMAELIEQTKGRLREEAGKSFLLYQTAGGLRALCTSHKAVATDEETLNLMKRVCADPLYVTLCKSQKCFRARLSPKPWRLQPPMHDENTDIRTGKDDPSEEWIEEYEQKSKLVRACRLIEQIGPENTDPTFLEALHAHNSSVGTAERLA